MAFVILAVRVGGDSGGAGLVLCGAGSTRGASSHYRGGTETDTGHAIDRRSAPLGHPALMERRALQSERGRADVELFQLWVRGLDILQLVFHLYGAGTRTES